MGLYDGTDRLVARDGQTIQVSGVRASSAAFAGEACLPDSGDVAVVQSDVTVVGSLLSSADTLVTSADLHGSSQR